MPVKTGKEYRFMEMMAHNPEKAKGSKGPSQAVAEEMIHKTPAAKRKQFAKKPNG